MKSIKRRTGSGPLKKSGRFEPIYNASMTHMTIFVPPDVQKVHPKKMKGSEESVPKTEAAAVNGRQKQNPFTKSRTHRCTFYSPSNEDFGQLADANLPPHGYNQNPQERNDLKPGTDKPEQKNACEGSVVQTRSVFVDPASGLNLNQNIITDLIDDEQWLKIDSISAAHFFLSRSPSPEKTKTPKDEKCGQLVRGNIRISNTPHVKRIAEKFVKFKRNNIEVRKLEERVVCLEYDVFELDAAEPTAPAQTMRAFFSIKMKDLEGDNNKKNIPFIPSGVKRNFNIDDGDLQNLNRKEIEIIDDQIPENRSLLEDLKRVLRRKQALENKKRQQTLDLMSLYEMAIRESPPLNYDYSNTNLLSKAELQEIKNLILKKCASSVYGINRKTIKCKERASNHSKCVLSNSLICEVMREAGKV